MDALIAAAVEEKRALVGQPGAAHPARRGGHRPPAGPAARRWRWCPAPAGSRWRRRSTALGVTDAFAFLLGAEDYGRGKPDPEPYRLAMERLGVAAGRCLVHRGRHARHPSARAAGARVIAVRAGNFSGYDLSAAHVVVDTLDEVTDDALSTGTAQLRRSRFRA